MSNYITPLCFAVRTISHESLQCLCFEKLPQVALEQKTLLHDRNSVGTSWIWRGPASGRGGSAHRLRSGRLEPRGGLPLRHLGLGAVPPPQHGAAAEPAERLLRSQLKVRARCASPARPSPCHAAYTKQAPPEPCLYQQRCALLYCTVRAPRGVDRAWVWWSVPSPASSHRHCQKNAGGVRQPQKQKRPPLTAGQHFPVKKSTKMRKG